MPLVFTYGPDAVVGRMSDRIVVMHGGTVSGSLDRTGATQERILALALGQAEVAA